MQAMIAELRYDSPPPCLDPWLEDRDSLTARLKRHCRIFSVRLLREWQGVAAEAGPDWQVGDILWYREVLLCLDNVPWVFALTEVPQATLDAGAINFKQLGERPLGELLFNNRAMKKGTLEVSRHDHHSRAYQVALFQGQTPQGLLWGRGRHFTLAGHSLRVNEIFLPAAVAHLAATPARI